MTPMTQQIVQQITGCCDLTENFYRPVANFECIVFSILGKLSTSGGVFDGHGLCDTQYLCCWNNCFIQVCSHYFTHHFSCSSIPDFTIQNKIRLIKAQDLKTYYIYLVYNVLHKLPTSTADCKK